MKTKFYIMGAALVMLASVSFTACSDNDDEPKAPEEFVVPSEAKRIKIGDEFRVPLTELTISGAGEYHAYSLNPDVADVETDADGSRYVAAYKNGQTNIVLSDAAGRYKKVAIVAYTTEEMKLNTSALTFLVPLGFSATNTDVEVVEGNGDYTVESDNPSVEVSIDPVTGQVSITSTGRKNAYTATVTITDCSGLSAKVEVTVESSFEGFTQNDIDEILAKTESLVYGQVKDPSDDVEPYYFWYRYYGYGSWINSNEDGKRTIGWWMNQWGNDYGGLTIEFPSDAAVDEEVSGTLAYQYSVSQWYPKYTYDGTVKLLEDSEERVVAIFWNVDLDNERINRGWVVQYK